MFVFINKLLLVNKLKKHIQNLCLFEYIGHTFLIKPVMERKHVQPNVHSLSIYFALLEKSLLNVKSLIILFPHLDIYITKYICTLVYISLFQYISYLSILIKKGWVPCLSVYLLNDHNLTSFNLVEKLVKGSQLFFFKSG